MDKYFLVYETNLSKLGKYVAFIISIYQDRKNSMFLMTAEASKLLSLRTEDQSDHPNIRAIEVRYLCLNYIS